MSFADILLVPGIFLMMCIVTSDLSAQRRISIRTNAASGWRPTRKNINEARPSAHHKRDRHASGDRTLHVAQNRQSFDKRGGQPEVSVQLDLDREVALSALADRVSELLGLNIIYDSEQLKPRIRIVVPAAIPKSALLPLLQSSLQMKGFVLEERGNVGWKRIVPATQLTSVASLENDQVAVTKIFPLTTADPMSVDASVKSFLTRGGNSRVLKDLRVLIVTDYAKNVQRIGQLVNSLNLTGPEVRIQPIPIQHSDALQLSEQVKKLQSSRATARSGAAANGAKKAAAEITVDPRTNQLIVIGDGHQIAEVIKIINSLDIEVTTKTKAYKFQNAKASRVAKVIDDLLDTGATGRFSSAIDEDSNQLLVSATAPVLEKIDQLIESLDKSPPPEQSRVRFHKLQNVTASELLVTLQSLQGSGEFLQDDGEYGTRIRGVSSGIRSGIPSRSNQRGAPRRAPFVPGANRPTTPGQLLPAPPSLIETGSNDVFRGQTTDADQESQLVLPSENARITADENSNSLIIVAEPEVQRVYEELIKTLDRRRPQVLIEARFVLIDTSDSYTLGVEVSGGDRIGSRKLFNFTSYGLSTVDPVTGALAITPGFGYNGTLVDPETADVVVRALTTHRRARVISAPRVLVNDNALGVLTSVDEVPFSSVNASNVVATTSFAGFAEAGTTIEVTPHISKDDYLQLEYRVILNTFTGTGGEGIPPPRNTNEVSSTVTIPDGHTVIVGGLNQHRKAQEVESLPWIEKIPVVKHLASLDNQEQANSTLFLFLRPVILRGDKFKKLKFYSERDLHRSGEPADFPTSRPVLMR